MKASDTRRARRVALDFTVLGLGGAPLGNLFRAVSDDAASSVVDAAWDAGMRYFDTAPLYGHTLAEHRLGHGLRERPRNEFILSTKVGRLLRPRRAPDLADGAWIDPLPFEPVFDYSHVGVMRSFEDSLQRLGVARIDLVLVHDIGELTHGVTHAQRWHQLTAQGGLKALAELRQEGQIRAFGLGVNEVQAVRDVMAVAEIDVVLLAGRHTLLEQSGLDLLDDCAARDISVVIGGPFNSGILVSGSAHPGNYDYGLAPEAVVAKVRALEAVCEVYSLPLAAAAIQFPLAHAAVVSCIPGCASVDELQQCVAWLEHPIPAAFWAELRYRGLLDCPAPC